MSQSQNANLIDHLGKLSKQNWMKDIDNYVNGCLYGINGLAELGIDLNAAIQFVALHKWGLTTSPADLGERIREQTNAALKLLSKSSGSVSMSEFDIFRETLLLSSMVGDIDGLTRAANWLARSRLQELEQWSEHLVPWYCLAACTFRTDCNDIPDWERLGKVETNRSLYQLLEAFKARNLGDFEGLFLSSLEAHIGSTKKTIGKQNLRPDRIISQPHSFLLNAARIVGFAVPTLQPKQEAFLVCMSKK